MPKRVLTPFIGGPASQAEPAYVSSEMHSDIAVNRFGAFSPEFQGHPYNQIADLGPKRAQLEK